MRLAFLLLFAGLVGSSSAQAAFLDRVDLPPAVVSGFVTHHLGTHQHYNEDNYGAGFRFSGVDTMVGYYKNSHYKNSVYAVYEARWEALGPLQIGAIAGGVTGYGMAVLPLVMPELVVKARRVELATAYAPRIAGHNPALLTMQARLTW